MIPYQSHATDLRHTHERFASARFFERGTRRRMTTTPHPYLVCDEATESQIIIHAVGHACPRSVRDGRFRVRGRELLPVET
jgi:hypothetical protein